MLQTTNSFSTPKPIKLLRRILQIGAPTNALILDFFAGSGTTLHAVMALNAEDGGNRQCILVTNNENNIAEEVCYERNRRVIMGYTNSKGRSGVPVAVPGLPGNALRYYQTTLVGREKTLANKRALMRQATDLLCLKEGMHEEVALTATEGTLRLFRAGDRYMLLVYDEDVIEQAIDIINSLLQTEGSAVSLPIKVHVSSAGSYPYADDFAEVLPYITLTAQPEALYRAYKTHLPNPK